MGYPYLHVALAGILLILGALWDIVFRRIPNGVSAALASAGLAAQLAAHGIRGALLGLLAGAVIAVLLWVPWTKRAIGGGDLKLGAAAAIWVGFSALPFYLVCAAIVAGLFSLVSFSASAREARQEMSRNLVEAASGERLWHLGMSSPGRVSVPLGAALGAGAFMALSFAG